MGSSELFDLIDEIKCADAATQPSAVLAAGELGKPSHKIHQPSRLAYSLFLASAEPLNIKVNPA